MDSQPLTSAAGPIHSSRWSPAQVASWAVLLVPLACLLTAAILYDYRPAPAAANEESTYLMQAESLLHDGDLQYSRFDFDRHLLSRYGAPTDLRLATGSGGREITFDHPFPYALWLTPFLALRPGTGFALANVLLLTLTTIWVAIRLRPVLGPSAPALLGILIFGSALFAHTFFATADLFLFCLILVACTLIREHPTLEDIPNPRHAMIAGALISIPIMSSPLHLPVALALALSLPKRERGALAVAGGLGCFLGSLMIVMVQWWSGGGLRVFGTSRFKFTPETGYPTVEFAAPQWREMVAQLSALHWEGALKLAWGFDPQLWGWNLLHLFAGQSFGIVPYFLPLLVLPWLANGDAPGRRGWWIALFTWIVTLLVLRPFDLSGGEAVVANRWLVPLSAASVLAWGRPSPTLWRLPRALCISVGSVLFAAPFLWQLWFHPGAHPITKGESYRYPTAPAKALLPYEISQRTMPGGPLLDHLGIRVRLMDRGLAEDYLDRLSMAGDRPAKLWLASPEPLASIDLEMDEQAPAELILAGAKIQERILLADGGISFRLEPELYRRHNLWWSPRPQWIYRLGFSLPNPTDRRIRFRLVGDTIIPVFMEETPNE